MTTTPPVLAHPPASHPAPNPPTSPGPNASPTPRPPHLPRPRRLGNTGKGLALLAVLALAGVALASWRLLGGTSGARPDLLTHRVGYEDLVLTIVERGALESAHNVDIVCRVKAGTKNSTVATTIKWVIDDGTSVKAGDKLVELDSSGLEDQLSQEKIVVDKARADFIQANENYKIIDSQNQSDIESARLTLDLALIDLEKYLKGDYLQTKRDIEGRTMMAKSDLEMWEERSAWSERMSKPGRRYVTTSQAQSDHARMVSAEIALQKVEEEMRVLEDYTAKQEVKKRQGAIDEARRALERVKKQAIAKEAQADADRKAKESIYHQELAKYADIEEEIKKCVIEAPQAGLVIYYVSDQSRFGSGSQQSIIAQGEPVREGQKLIRLPDLTHMLVNTRVNEALISHVRGEKWAKTGFGEAVQASLLAEVNPFARLAGQAAFAEAHTAFRENHRKQELMLVEQGQPARIRIDAFTGKQLRGHVASVASVSSQQDWLSADVKVYKTLVMIDEPLEGLKPDMSAEVTIFTDSRVEHVLAVPIQAVLGTLEMGEKRRCFVQTPHGPEEREITVGLTNEKMVEVKTGLQEGDLVVLNPRTLEGEQGESPTESPGPAKGSPPAEAAKAKG